MKIMLLEMYLNVSLNLQISKNNGVHIINLICIYDKFFVSFVLGKLSHLIA